MQVAIGESDKCKLNAVVKHGDLAAVALDQQVTLACKYKFNEVVEQGDLAAIAPDNKDSHNKFDDAITDHYEVTDKIGEGGLGVVYRGVRRSDSKPVALKVVRFNCQDKLDIVKAEFLVLKNINHPNIVQALDFLSSGCNAVLVLSRCAGNTLDVAVKLEQEKQFAETTSHKMFRALARALDCLHERSIVHGDIKPQNMMVSCNLSVLQLIDFNTARHFSPDRALLSPNYTPKYAAPEVRHGGGSSSPAGDIWGVGSCLCYMLTGRWPRLDMQAQKVTLKSEKLSIVSQPCVDTMHNCIAIEPSMRPEAAMLLKLDWVVCGPKCSAKEGTCKLSRRERPCSCGSCITVMPCAPMAL